MEGTASNRSVCKLLKRWVSFENMHIIANKKLRIMFLNEVIPLCIDSIYSLYYIYFSQHKYIIKAKVKATCLNLKGHRQANLRTMKFFTVWLCAFGIPDGSQCVL